MLSSLIASFVFRLLLVLVVEAPKAFTWRGDGTRNTPCGCYLVNGTRHVYYESIFWMDFRDLKVNGYRFGPRDIEDWTEALNAPPTSNGYFEQKLWRQFFRVHPWTNVQDNGKLQGDATYPMINSQNNVFIERNQNESALPKTWLTLRTKRMKRFQTVAEFQTNWGNFQFVSLRMLARTIGKPGAVTSMFTYRDITGELSKIQESDVEFLTRGPRDKIQYTNQPSYTHLGMPIPAATINATTPDWSEWAVHRLDWTPEEVFWYVNGNKTASLKFNTPKLAADLFFSAWGDGGSWSGVMEVGDEARLQIQWIHLVFNTTEKFTLKEDRVLEIGGDKPLIIKPKKSWKSLVKEKYHPGGVCRVVCSIDSSDQPEREIILSQNMATSKVSLLGSTLWLSVVAIGLFLFTKTLV